MQNPICEYELARLSGAIDAEKYLRNQVLETTKIDMEFIKKYGDAHICNIVKINDKYVVVDLANFTYSVFNKEFSELSSKEAKYELHSLFEHNKLETLGISHIKNIEERTKKC